MIQETMIIGGDSNRNFKEIATKVRIRRIITAAILITAAAVITIALWNYKTAGDKPKPAIVFSTKTESYAAGEYTLYYSLGFKHVLYKSEYGRNYYERLMLWEDVDVNTVSLTNRQYKQMNSQIREYYDKQYDSLAELKKHFSSFGTYNSSILDIRKDGNQLTIYMQGHMENYIEYGGEVYGKPSVLYNGNAVESIDAYDPSYDQEDTSRMIVKATVSGDNLRVTDIKDYQNQELGESGSINLYEIFPKPVARIMLTGDYNIEVLAAKARNRSDFDAVAHFGKPLAEDKYLEYDPKSDKSKVIDITYENVQNIAF